MKIFGAQLKTPSWSRAVGTGAVFLIFCWLIATAARSNPDIDAFGLSAGALGGAVASAYGVSFREHGLKALPITAIFVLLLAIMAKIVRHLFS